MLKRLKAAAAKELENNENLNDKQREQAKQLLGEALDVFAKTIDLKKSDGGMSVVLEGGPVIIGGGLIAEGNKLNETFKKLINELSADKPELKNLVKLNAETYEGVTFHVAKIPINDAEAQEVFGDTVRFAVGLSDSRIYVGAGKNPIDWIKKAIDASKASPEKLISPVEMVISAEPIAKFLAKVIPERSCLTPAPRRWPPRWPSSLPRRRARTASR